MKMASTRPHSLDTLLDPPLQLLRHHAPQRTSGLCLIDPICCMLHHAQISRISFRCINAPNHPRARNLLERLRALPRSPAPSHANLSPPTISLLLSHARRRACASLSPLPPPPPPPCSGAFVYKPVGNSLKTAVEESCPTRDLLQQRDHASHGHEAALWPTDCSPSMPTTIVLSEEDTIVPVDAVRGCARSWRAYTRGVRVLTLPRLGHGGWLGQEDALDAITSRVKALCSK